MTFPANPTAVSAVVGDRLRFGAGPGWETLLKGLTMPAIISAFATYLLVGIVTMSVPEGTSFPGPQFFPAIIAGALYVFAALLVVAAVREARVSALPPSVPVSAGPADAHDDDAVSDDAIAGIAGSSAPARAVRVDIRSLAWVVLPFLAFAFVLDILGWILAAGALFWCVARAFGSTRPVQSLIVGLTVSSIAYIGFDMMLGMPLPSGILGGF